MAKQKKSFFEKLTGIKKIDEDDGDVNFRTDDNRGRQSFASYETQEESYEFPEYDYGENDAKGMTDQNRDYEEEVPVSHPRAPQPVGGSGSMVDSEGQLTIDVYQTDDDIVIKSTIAGVKPEDLDVNINNDMVTIRGERRQDEDIDQENYYYQECYWGPFSRSVILPVEIITEKAEASMKNGILTIRLPKADVTKTRRIQVRGF